MTFEKQQSEQMQSKLESKEKIKAELLIPLQLKYISNLKEKRINFLEETDKNLNFKELLYKYTDLPNLIYWSYLDKFGGFPKGDSSNFIDFDRKITEGLDNLYLTSPGDWDNNAVELVRKVTENWEYTGEIEKYNTPNKESAGYIEYEVSEDIQGLEGLKDFGVEQGDSLVFIHIPTIKENISDSESFTPFPARMLKPMAELLNHKFNEVKGVVAISWIVGSPIGRSIGFHNFAGERFRDYYQGENFWGQFFDQNGEIKKGIFEKFIQTGQPSYLVKGGYLAKEEFLEKFLS